MEVAYKPTFIRQFRKFQERLRDEIIEKTELFKNPKNHKTLKVHKLRGRLAGFYSFSVNYKYRVVFEYETKTKVVFLAVGDHDMYDA